MPSSSRYLWLRVHHGPGHRSNRHGPHALSLWRAALSASEETLQTGFMSVAWQNLFRNQLSQTDRVWLRWKDDLGSSAEIRRAYSALYGRFFARAVLSSNLTLSYFIPLRRDITTLTNGVTVNRIASGDIPDWVAWDHQHGGYALGEAKGALTGEADALWGPSQPKCVTSGKAQFARVEIRDTHGAKIASRDWVGANFWATDRRPRMPMALLWDPPSEGRELTEDEIAAHRQAIATRWVMSLLPGFGRTELLRMRRQPIENFDGPIVRITARRGDPLREDKREGGYFSPEPEPKSEEIALYRLLYYPPSEPFSDHGHEGSYIVVLPTLGGLVPINSESRWQDLLTVQKEAIRKNRMAMIVGLNIGTILNPGVDHKHWLGDTGFANREGLSIFDIRSVKLESV
ncbi:hypothetical protein [Rhizobium oryzicola]|uniref:Tyr recombinase domain-containing protein n=1 Tax=Rhizobium oryzicola TaxID=1232668 RepID=A0ABT8T432_9HYPH|nr:hypothetical protein [Rhizobium oryzicola]MDO1585388.1 hypothetical protein [Rhizobium oryzicola]